MATWTITLFGQLRLWKGEQELKAFQHRKAGVLLSYLACHQQTWHNRNQLAAQLWPDSDTDAAKLSLRVALSRIRERLGSTDILETQGERVRLSSAEVGVDVTRFTAAIAKQDWETATRLYCAPLLPHYDEIWVATERERLNDQFLSALFQLAEGAHHEQRWDDAIAYARRAVSAAPLREDTHQKLIRFYVDAGRPANAQAQFRQLDQLFRDELKTLPSPQTRALLSQPPVPKVPLVPLTEPAQPSRPHLPHSRTRFFGRESELATLQTYLSEPGALVSIVGFAGMGKTRLAVEAALALESSLPVFWVPLADTPSEANLWNALAGQLLSQTSQAPVSLSTSSEQQALQLLQQQPTVLILDNTEHLNQELLCNVLVALRRQLPMLTILVTSRRRLGIDDEQVLALGPLQPDLTQILFYDRAKRALPDFIPPPQTQNLVVRLCERLEGMPLAIEMAAARVRILSLSQILQRLDQRFTLLSDQTRGGKTRQTSLQAALDWSYELLSPDARTLLSLLAAFRGGFTLEAAEALYQTDNFLDIFTELADASLIFSTSLSEQPRYRMYEALREFVLLASPVARQHEALALHAQFFDRALQAFAGYPTKVERNAFIDQEYENVRAALVWLQQQHTNEYESFRTLVALTEVLADFLIQNSRTAEGKSLLFASVKKFLSMPTIGATELKIIRHLAYIIQVQNDASSLDELEAICVDLLQNIQDDAYIAEIENALGYLNIGMNKLDRAIEYLIRCGNRREKLNKPDPIIWCNVAVLYERQNAMDRVEEYIKRALPFRDGAAPRAQGIIACMYGYVLTNNYNYDSALEEFNRALAIFEKENDQNSISKTKRYLASLYVQTQNWHGALEIYQPILQSTTPDSEWDSIKTSLLGFSHCQLGLDQPQLALQALSCLRAFIALRKMQLTPQELTEIEEAEATCHQHCSEPQLAAGSSDDIVTQIQKLLRY